MFVNGNMLLSKERQTNAIFGIEQVYFGVWTQDLGNGKQMCQIQGKRPQLLTLWPVHWSNAISTATIDLLAASATARCKDVFHPLNIRLWRHFEFFQGTQIRLEKEKMAGLLGWEELMTEKGWSRLPKRITDSDFHISTLRVLIVWSAVFSSIFRSILPQLSRTVQAVSPSYLNNIDTNLLLWRPYLEGKMPLSFVRHPSLI